MSLPRDQAAALAEVTRLYCAWRAVGGLSTDGGGQPKCRDPIAIRALEDQIRAAADRVRLGTAAEEVTRC